MGNQPEQTSHLTNRRPDRASHAEAGVAAMRSTRTGLGTNLRLARDLDMLGKRIELRESQLRERGHFPEMYAAEVEAIRRRRIKLERRVAAAIRTGSAWAIITSQLARDYGALFHSILLFERRVDADYSQRTARQKRAL